MNDSIFSVLLTNYNSRR